MTKQQEEIAKQLLDHIQSGDLCIDTGIACYARFMEAIRAEQEIEYAERREVEHIHRQMRGEETR